MKPEFSVPHLSVQPQPDDESCGITCLQAIYNYHGQKTPFDKLQSEIEHFNTGGTVGVNLARHAILYGYSAEIYTYNIKIFDPTWKNLGVKELSAKLKLRQKKSRSQKQKKIIGFYHDFLRKGGVLKFDDLNEALLDKLLAKNQPMICGLSATYLYQNMRETPNNEENDILGNPVGHFVVVSEWDPKSRHVTIHDPLRKNPISDTGTYRLPFVRFSNAVMLGILTYDENLLVIAKK